MLKSRPYSRSMKKVGAGRKRDASQKPPVERRQFIAQGNKHRKDQASCEALSLLLAVFAVLKMSVIDHAITPLHKGKRPGQSREGSYHTKKRLMATPQA
jgi:hypothetical protein